MGNEFNSNKKYNSENYVSLSININKSRYSQEAYIKGFLYLKGKHRLIQTELIDPLAISTLTKLHHYQYEEEVNSDDRREMTEQEERTIFSLRLDFSNYREENLIGGDTNFVFSLNYQLLPYLYF